MMPEVDGFEVLRRLREDERTREVPVVVLTAKTSQEDRDQCFALGADAFMIRPFDPDELKRELDSLMV
jgi:CheY-like chemotaxis protein